jgi:hypothetical protein
VPGNRVWAQNAAALVLVASRTRFEYNDRPSITHAFDAGSAWENLAIEASRRGLVAHGMEGFDYARAKTELSIPDDFEVHAIIAIGRRGPAENLPGKQREMEHPNSRRPLLRSFSKEPSADHSQGCLEMISASSPPEQGSVWPELPLASWAGTASTLHMWTQIVGTIRLALSPHVNHWSEVPLYPCGPSMWTRQSGC